ncbi:MAG TPA: carboxypeptidase regulatory-like domain-containing protein [Pyrinomonadaceae bacterium]|nr:carboxypeptidase regulatory-like domain-containing protein [Pyrinomonadaceae bacterium]
MNLTPQFSFRFSLRFTFYLIFCCFGAVDRTVAQNLDNVIIGGRVVDQNGAVIPGASVTAVLTRTGSRRTAVADTDGRYRILQLEPGTYVLRASAEGFAVQDSEGIAVISGQNLQVEIVLLPQGVIVDPVSVTFPQSQSVDTTRTVVGGTVTAHEVESLPVATRSPLDLIFTLGGVTEEPLSTRELAEDRDRNPASAPEEAGTFAISGGPAYSNNLTIDGLDNNDDRAARERFQPSLEAVEEVQVITNQFSAEYGRASGGRINIRTRGGAQTFRGRAFYFFKDESLNANTFRNNSLRLKRLPLQEHTPGFTLSGPVIIPWRKNPTPTFFFGSYEFNKALDSALTDTLVPVQQNSRFPLPSPTLLQGRRFEDANAPAASAEIAPFISSVSTPLTNHTVTTRIDHQFSETHNGALVYQLGRSANLRQFGGGNRLAEALQAKTRNSDAISYSDNYVFSANTVNQIRAQLSRLAPGTKTGGGANPVVLITINDPLIAGDPARRSGTLVAGSSTTGATDRREDRFQVQDIVFHNRGTHSLKFGFDVQRIRSTFIDLSDASGTFSFASAGDFLAGIPSRFRQNFLTESTQRNTYVGFFGQDEWRLFPNVVVSYGLRYERESIIHDRNNFAPRFSVAYDPFSSGKTVLRFGAGLFYNRALLRTIDDFTLGTRRLFFDTNSLRDPDSGKLMSAAQRRVFIATNLHFPQTLTIESPPVAQFGELNTEFSRRLDPRLRIPESYQANFGVERDIGSGFVFEANYTLNRGIHLWREFNANAAVLPAGFKNFSEYLASRDFPNFRGGPAGDRPLYNASTAGELIRFVFVASDNANPNSVGRRTEFGVPVSLVNLNSLTSSTSVEVALAALNDLRPDATRAEVEQLIAAGNSFYQGLTLELRRRFNQSSNSFGFSFRAAYTFANLVDDGVVNTSDALRPGDFRRERARSLLDRNHRFAFSGTFDLPAFLGKFRLSPVLRIASGAPFNISIGGVDRNLDDVGNDRPNFTGNTELLRWRGPNDPIDPTILNLFALPTIGQSGNLPRNAGRGPGLFLFDLSVTREFRFTERVRLRPVIEFDNVLNKTVFSFGAEFINFNALAPTATLEQRKAFLDSFLVTSRTLRPRQIRLGIRIDF